MNDDPKQASFDEYRENMRKVKEEVDKHSQTKIAFDLDLPSLLLMIFNLQIALSQQLDGEDSQAAALDDLIKLMTSVLLKVSPVLGALLKLSLKNFTEGGGLTGYMQFRREFFENESRQKSQYPSWPPVPKPEDLVGKKFACAQCGHFATITDITGKQLGAEAQYVMFICSFCATIQVFEPSGGLRRMTEPELLSIPAGTRAKMAAYLEQVVHRIQNKSNLN